MTYAARSLGYLFQPVWRAYPKLATIRETARIFQTSRPATAIPAD